MATSATSDVDTFEQMDDDQLLDFYRQMYLIRRFEERAAEQYAYGKIGGFLHLYIGEEAIAVGAIAAMTESDHLFTHYRDHGYALAIGASPDAAMAELFGKEPGTTKGRGGSMHMVHPERNFWGGYAIVGGHIPLAVGAGLAIKHKREDAVSVAIFGDGSTNSGAFHEAANMASLWKLPVVFLCENNHYGMGTAVEYASAVPQMSTKAEGHGIETEIVDGQDVVAVYEAMQRAVQHCKEGNGPYFLEAMTYRFRGHSMADPEAYRDRQEIDHYRERDPIPMFKNQLQEAGRATAEDFETIEAGVEEIVENAVQFADASEFPDPSTIFDWIYYSEGEAGKGPNRG